MPRAGIFCSLVLGGLVAAGCSKEESTAPQASPSAAPSSNAPAVPSVDASKATEAVSDTSKKAGDAAASANTEAQGEGQKLIAQATDYIKQNKLDDADNVLKKLEDMKGQLPQSLQDQVAALR